MTDLFPLDIRVEALINGEWINFGPTDTFVDDFYTDTYSDLYSGRIVTDDRRLPRQEISTRQGRSDEASIVETSEWSVDLWNDDGKLTVGMYLLDGGVLNDWCPSWGLGTQMRKSRNGQVTAWGEVSDVVHNWPEGDNPGPDDIGRASVTVTVSGIRRRLSQNTTPLRSALERRALSMEGPVVAYWPFEDGQNSTSLAHVLVNHKQRPGSITGFDMASDETLPGSDPLPKLSKGSTGSWSVQVNAASLDGGWGVDLWWSFSELPTIEPSASRVFDIATTGDIHWYLDVVYVSNEVNPARLWLRGFDTGGALVVSQYVSENLVGQGLIGQPVKLNLRVIANEWQVTWPGHAALGSGSWSAGYPTMISGTYAPSAADVVVGHLSVHAPSLNVLWAVPADVGYIGETAGDRMYRLASEENEPFTILYPGDPAKTSKMGPQKAMSFLDLMDECAKTDGGLFGERRSLNDLTYLTRRSLYNQSPYLTLDAHLNEIANPFTPVSDDQKVVNDMTVTRIGGSKFRKIRDDDGEGVFDDSEELSLDSDHKGRLKNQAGWRLHLGKNDKPRYPELIVDFSTIDDDGVLLFLASSMRPGSLIRIINLPAQHPQAAVDLIVQGWNETESADSLKMTFNCTPAEHFRVGRWAFSRWAPRDPKFASSVSDVATSISVSSGGTLFTLDPGAYPLNIFANGEEMLVTDCTGSSSPQTMTVVRGVNGLTRSHPSGESFQVVDTAVLGL